LGLGFGFRVSALGHVTRTLC